MNQQKNNKIKVLIADDSQVGRKLLAYILTRDPMIDVIAFACDGKEAYELTKKFKPDVVSMDINMPVMDGIEATRKIMSSCPVPIIIVSGIYRETDTTTAFDELEAGALMVLPKPQGPNHKSFDTIAQKYINAVKMMAEIKVVKRSERYTKFSSYSNTGIVQNSNTELNSKSEIIVIGSSAGGPEALRSFLTNISPNFPLPIVLVQHIESNFTHGFANWLNTFSNLIAIISEENTIPKGGNLYISPPNRHIVISNGKLVTLGEDETETIYKPSIDLLFNSVSKYYEDRAVGIILSGMGKDGANGLSNIKKAGGYTFVQDKITAMIYGMPGEALKQNAANAILSPIKIAKILNFTFI